MCSRAYVGQVATPGGSRWRGKTLCLNRGPARSSLPANSPAWGARHMETALPHSHTRVLKVRFLSKVSAGQRVVALGWAKGFQQGHVCMGQGERRGPRFPRARRPHHPVHLWSPGQRRHKLAEVPGTALVLPTLDLGREERPPQGAGPSQQCRRRWC